MSDNTIVGIRCFPNSFAFIIPMSPTGIPAKKISVLPPIPTYSNNPNRKLEFRIFVGVILHQIINGMSATKNNSNQNNIRNAIIFVFFILPFTPQTARAYRNTSAADL